MPTQDAPSPQSLLNLTLLRESELRSLLKISHSTIYALIKRGLFPSPLRIGLRAVAWRESDIHGWIDARAGTSTNDKPAKPADAKNSQTRGGND